MASYCVITAKTRGGVIALAEDNGWEIQYPIREFDDLDSLDDGSLGDIGRLLVADSGYVALGKKE